MGKKKREQHDTVKMTREELDTILSVDAAMAKRGDLHDRPTVTMSAVKPN